MGRKSKTTTINSLDVNSNTFTDPKDIAQELNHHFSTIADKIASESKKNNDNTMGDKEASYYLSFIPKQQKPFKFQLTFTEFHFETEAKVDFPSACI